MLEKGKHCHSMEGWKVGMMIAAQDEHDEHGKRGKPAPGAPCENEWVTLE
jgi:hypothetical protein